MKKLFFFILMLVCFFIVSGTLVYANGPPDGESLMQCDFEPGGDKIFSDQVFNIAQEERDRGYLSSVPSEGQIKFLYDNIAADEAIFAETVLIYDDDSRFLLTTGFEVNIPGQEEPMNRTGGNRIVWVVNIGNSELDPGI